MSKVPIHPKGGFSPRTGIPAVVVGGKYKGKVGRVIHHCGSGCRILFPGMEEHEAPFIVLRYLRDPEQLRREILQALAERAWRERNLPGNGEGPAAASQSQTKEEDNDEIARHS